MKEEEEKEKDKEREKEKTPKMLPNIFQPITTKFSWKNWNCRQSSCSEKVLRRRERFGLYLIEITPKIELRNAEPPRQLPSAPMGRAPEGETFAPLGASCGTSGDSWGALPGRATARGTNLHYTRSLSVVWGSIKGR